MDSLIVEDGHLIANLLHFARLLRHLGMKISVSQVTELAHALTLIDMTRRQDFFDVTRGLWITDPAHFDLFEQAFDLFWQGRQQWMLSFAQTRRYRPPDESSPEAEKNSTFQESEDSAADDEESAEQNHDPDQISLNAVYSAIEVLRHKNFAHFSDDEKEIAKHALQMLVWQFDDRLTRRLRKADKRARYLDLRATIRKNIIHSGEIIDLSWRQQKTKPRPLISICDISGSMDQYSRLFLHFIYLLNQGRQRTEAFVFGTRLTRLTPALRHRDIDTAITDAAQLVVDWSGGTRIGQSLKTFNYQWSRRVLGNGAIVLIISDGWERGDMALLAKEIKRLSESCWRLFWLNPMAGSPGYQPLVKGIETVLPYCDEFLPLHNLHSLEQLVLKLGKLNVRTGDM